MTEKLFEWLSDKFGAELQQKVPLAAIFAAMAWVLLNWAGERGSYLSAFLSLMNVAPAALTKEDLGVAQLPMYVFACGVGGALTVFAGVKLFARTYFRFVINLPKHRLKIQHMVEEHAKVRIGPMRSHADELREAEGVLEQRRSQVRIHVLIYEWLSMLGTTLLFAAFIGNVLDLTLGLVSIACATVALFRGVGQFIARVTPWYAKVDALSKALVEGSAIVQPQSMPT